MTRKKAIVFVVLFFIFIALPNTTFFFVGKYIDTKNYENRSKAQRPPLTLDTYSDFPKKYEKFFDDNIPFRNQLIRLSSSIDYFLFGQPSDKRVVVGKDGWLFYRRDTDGNPVRHSRGFWHFTNEELNKISDNLVKARDELRKKNIEFVLFIAPNKESIYGEYIPDYYPIKDKIMSTDQLVKFLKEKTDIRVVYPKAEILEAKSQYTDVLFYKKLDTHWNQLGAYIGAKALAKELGISMPDFGNLKYKSNLVSSGDLTNMLNIQITDGDINYSISGISKNKTEYKDKDKKKMIQDYTTTSVEGEKRPDLRRVLIRGDSFRTALVPSLATQFQNLRVVHNSVYNKKQIFDYNSDIFVYVRVERLIRGLLNFKL